MTVSHLSRISLTLALLASGPGLAAGKEILIGVAGPHTGASAPFGLQLWKGAEQAVADINKAGGINGTMLRAVKADDACLPAQAKTIANKLVNTDKVNAVVGHFCSSATITADGVYRENNLLAITPASTNPKVTEDGSKGQDCSSVSDKAKKDKCELSHYSTVMRTCGRDDQQGTEAAEFIVKKLKAQNVAVLHDKDTYGQGLADAMKAHLKELNGKTPVLYEGLTRGEKDFNALVTKIKAAKADVVYFGGLYSEAGPLLRQMREQGLKAAFISGDGIVSNDFLTAAGGIKFVEGAYMTFGADLRNSPAGQAVVANFRKANYEPEGYTLYSYAAVQAIAQAMKGTGEVQDGHKLSKWLVDNGADTVMGKINWTQKGDLSKSGYVMYQWDKAGKYAEVK